MGSVAHYAFTEPPCVSMRAGPSREDLCQRVRHIRARVGEVRRVADIHCLAADLGLESFRYLECAEDAHIQVGVAGAAKLIESRRAEACAGHGRIGQRIEVRQAAHAAPDFGHVRIDQVRDL
jgi:hypothetical protein